MMKEKDKNFKLVPQRKPYEMDLIEDTEDKYIKNMLEISEDEEESGVIDSE